jgi:hypothetical protein
VLAADMVAGSGAELVGVASAGVLVGALGVPSAIAVLGAGVVATASVLWTADRRDATAADLEPAPA